LEEYISLKILEKIKVVIKSEIVCDMYSLKRLKAIDLQFCNRLIGRVHISENS